MKMTDRKDLGPFALTEAEPYVFYSPDRSMASVPANVLNQLAQRIHTANCDAGWWNDMNNTDDPGRHLSHPNLFRYSIPTKLCLVHSEISEALEGFRKNLKDDHLPTRPMIEVELADALIRIFDIAGALNLDLGGALVEKFNYNQTRADHKPEARQGEHGKKI